jgi:spore germination cell wall hydrolase CwlJ-like protein
MNKWIGIALATAALIFMVRIETKLDNIQEQVLDLNRIVKTSVTVKYTAKDLECLARNIYYEAGVEDQVGKYAVGHVTLNRLSTGYWGKDICSVVYSKNQFSWTRLKKLPKPAPDLWHEAQSIAFDVIHGHRVASLDKTLFYHADYIKDPYWAVQEHKVTQIGRHIFYTKAKNSWLAML